MQCADRNGSVRVDEVLHDETLILELLLHRADEYAERCGHCGAFDFCNQFICDM